MKQPALSVPFSPVTVPLSINDYSPSATIHDELAVHTAERPLYDHSRVRESLENEAVAIAYIKEHTTLPVPKVLATFQDRESFFLMEEYVINTKGAFSPQFAFINISTNNYEGTLISFDRPRVIHVGVLVKPSAHSLPLEWVNIKRYWLTRYIKPRSHDRGVGGDMCVTMLIRLRNPTELSSFRSRIPNCLSEVFSIGGSSRAYRRKFPERRAVVQLQTRGVSFPISPTIPGGFRANHQS